MTLKKCHYENKSKRRINYYNIKRHYIFYLSYLHCVSLLYVLFVALRDGVFSLALLLLESSCYSKNK
ncbi:MAG: hypothetical protein ACJ71L_00320, partial [Nitrososphaeraceae archaeon]